MKTEVEFDYANASDADLAGLGLEAAREHFESARAAGLLEGDSLFLLVGTVDGSEDGGFVAWDRVGFGPDWLDCVENVDPRTGKIATAIEYRMDSALAACYYGEQLGDGPRSWTGGVYHLAVANLGNGQWRQRVFVGAASGVQGVFDADITSVALRRIGAAWALREQALVAAAAGA
jgi:hypothetical protein